MAGYKLGDSDPVIKHDKGAGKWASESPTPEMVALAGLIVQHLPHAYLVVGDNAAKHMYHYFGNSGNTYTIDLEGMLDDVPSAKAIYDAELAEAQKFVQTLPVGSHKIASQKARGGYNTKGESGNWYYAVGGYSAWGKGVATVGKDAAGAPGYKLDFELRFEDKYNWDTGKSVTLFKVVITDKFMGAFHRQGLAQEFIMTGSFKRTVTWGSEKAIAQPNAAGGGGR